MKCKKVKSNQKKCRLKVMSALLGIFLMGVMCLGSVFAEEPLLMEGVSGASESTLNTDKDVKLSALSDTDTVDLAPVNGGEALNRGTPPVLDTPYKEDADPEKYSESARTAGFNAFLENSKGLTTEQKQGLTEDQVMDLYDKYLAKYHVKGSDKLFDFIDETYNSDGSLSQESMDQALAIINFMRELVGIKTVTWDDDYNKASQAGVDFLKDNKLDIDHEAANGSGNALAAKGLMCSNLAQGSRSFYDLWDLLLMFYGDDDASNRVALGHRAWMFNSSNTKMGLGYTTGNGLNYLAIYVMDMSNGYESDQYSDVNGSMPEEILEEIRTSISCPWQVGVGYDTDQDSDITVTITDSDGHVSVIPQGVTEENLFRRDWCMIAYNSTQYTVTINPYSLYEKYGYNLAGKRFTINISGLKTARGVLREDISYTVNFFSLLEVLQERGGVKDFIDRVNEIPTDLSWENFEAIKGIKETYDTLTDNQKALVSDDVEARLNAAYTMAERLNKEHQEDVKMVQTTVDKINAIGTVTLSSEALIKEARQAYDALSDAQKAMVDPALTAKLQEAEKIYETLVIKDTTDQKAVKSLADLVSTIPKTLKLADKGLVTQVRVQYDALTADQKKLVTGNIYSKLQEAENQIKILEAADKIDKEIQKEADAVALILKNMKAPGDLTLEDEAYLNTIVSRYSAMSEAAKRRVDSSLINKLEACITQMEKLKNPPIIPEKSVARLDNNAKEVSGIQVGENGAALIANLKDNNVIDKNVQVQILNVKGEAISADIMLATGMKIRITAGAKNSVETAAGVLEYTVVIKGDINGDGKVSAVDIRSTQNHILSKVVQTGCYLKAADTNADHKISAVDIRTIQNHILGKKSITQ